MMWAYRVRYFRVEEFRCPCCGQGRPAQLLVLFLDWTRRAWGGPVVVNSGFRCAPHNEAVGGAARSRHLIGCAADVRPRMHSDLPRFQTLVRNMTAGLEGWEVLCYGTFVHIGVPREEAARPWGGKAIPRRRSLGPPAKNLFARHAVA